ncbi:uncharacterized protein HGUI_04059 [Hanseniaspora guilliermondii]|uniref:Uncharacterized protein n=1 Tax=Hanseniaspora guilliermondii TaxID=56406 RepID=A0A1L0B638_9ASCO|nr:uncharacterized protein HGUI_04059 [Hanseniaspora guilliermondii]
MSDTISFLSKNSDQQKDSIKNDTHRKKSLDRIEMMKFLENIIQEEDQYRYQQSFQNENTSAIDFNLSPKSIGSTPTPFNNSRRSFSRSNSITRSTMLQKETTLTNTLNDVIINFQYDNRQNSIRIMDEERERLRQLIYNDKNEIIPPMFMQKREKPKFERTKRRHSSVINDVTPEPEDKQPKVVFNSFAEKSKNIPTPALNSPLLQIQKDDEMLKLKTKLMLLESEKELNINKIKGLDKDLAEKSELISDLKQNEHKLLNQLNKDKILIDKLVKELAYKDKQNFLLAQSLKK